MGGVTMSVVPEGWLEGVTTPVNGGGWSSRVFIAVDCEVSPAGGTWVGCEVSLDCETIERETNEAEWGV